MNFREGAFLLFLLAVTVHGKLQILNYQGDEPVFYDIPYSIANFGFSPFGKTMISNLRESPGLDQQCIQKTDNETSEYDFDSSFMLIPRGQCPFVTKAIHAQEMGALMAIIMDDVPHNRSIIMKDNGYGYKVNIPAIFIDYINSKKLLAQIRRTNNSVALKITFPSMKVEKSVVNFYLQSMNQLSYKFVQDFYQYYTRIGKYIDLNIVYDVSACKKCNPEDCFYNNQFCSLNYQHGQSAKGQDVLMQQLRESVMFTDYKQEFWDYIQCIKNQCVKISQLDQCSNSCVKNIEDDQMVTELNNKVTATFNFDRDNSRLRMMTAMLQGSGVQKFPSVTINSIKIKGSLKPEFVFDDICNSLKNPPEDCIPYVSTNYRVLENKGNYTFAIVMSFIIGTVFFVGLFIILRRKMRKRMTNEMQGRVDDMVSKYIEFYSQRNGRK